MLTSHFRLGIDEVGRGALAGPVTVAGVLTSPDFPEQTYHCNIHDFQEAVDKLLTSDSPPQPEFLQTLQLVRDSKKLSSIKRCQISNLIQHGPSYFNSLIVSTSNQLIDKYGIGVCLSHLVSLVILKLSLSQSNIQIIIDGQIKILSDLDPELCNQILIENQLEQDYFQNWSDFYANGKQSIHRENYGDDKYLSVALASNLAKVYRDDLMANLGLEYPEYLWSKNKGYGTLEHRMAIAKNPNNRFLRQSFMSKILKLDYGNKT